MDIQTKIQNAYEALDEEFNVTNSVRTPGIISNIKDKLTDLIDSYRQDKTFDYTGHIDAIETILTSYNTKIEKTDFTDEKKLNNDRQIAKKGFATYFEDELYEYLKKKRQKKSGGRRSYRSRKMKKHKKSKSHKKIRKGKRTKRRRY